MSQILDFSSSYFVQYCALRVSNSVSKPDSLLQFFSDTTLHRKSLFLHCINPYNFHTGAGRGVRGPAAYWRIFVQNRPIFGRLIVRRVLCVVTLDWVDRFSTEIEKKLVSICIYTFSFTHFCCSVVWGFEFLLELRSCKAIVFQLGHWLTLVQKELY